MGWLSPGSRIFSAPHCFYLSGLHLVSQKCQIPTLGPLHMPFLLPRLLLAPLADSCLSFRSQVKFHHLPTPSTPVKVLVLIS